MCIFALAFGKQVAMTDACIGGRLLPPLYPRTHEVLGWGRGNTAMRWEKIIIDVLEILDTLETLKILIIKPKF